MKIKRKRRCGRKNERIVAVMVYLLGLANRDWSESLLWLDNNSKSELAVCRAATALTVAALAAAVEEDDAAAAAAAANRVDGAVFWQDKQVQIELHGTPPW